MFSRSSLKSHSRQSSSTPSSGAAAATVTPAPPPKDSSVKGNIPMSYASAAATGTKEGPFSVAVVGGGLVGSLIAVYFARRGWSVSLYESRKDIRQQKHAEGRSINLALSARGIAALEAVDAGQGIFETLIPMKGRMIHTGKGNLSSQPYGVFGECISSFDRKLMNEHLLNTVEKLPNVKIFFEHELISAELDKKVAHFRKPDGSIVKASADFIVGADGAYSRVRRELMRVTRMNYSQEYIEHGYVELNMPPDATTGGYRMDPKHLHIWPRQTFMMIALPNLDNSFTVTLFMPWTKFDAIKTETDLLKFFESTFPDAVPLIGQDLLVKDYFKNPKGALMTVKCTPYHHKTNVLIVGDAAHAMVPFYGQGMNCGFEDCLVLDEILTKHIGARGSATSTHPSRDALAAALNEYTETRNPDARAICDLALHNYVEMRSSVTKTSYLIRKSIEKFLHKWMPKTVIPLYSMVSFSRIPYSEALRRDKRQAAWFNWVAPSLFVGAVAVGSVGVARLWLLKTN